MSSHIASRATGIDHHRSTPSEGPQKPAGDSVDSTDPAYIDKLVGHTVEVVGEALPSMARSVPTEGRRPASCRRTGRTSPCRGLRTGRSPLRTPWRCTGVRRSWAARRYAPGYRHRRRCPCRPTESASGPGGDGSARRGARGSPRSTSPSSSGSRPTNRDGARTRSRKNSPPGLALSALSCATDSAPAAAGHVAPVATRALLGEGITPAFRALALRLALAPIAARAPVDHTLVAPRTLIVVLAVALVPLFLPLRLGRR